MAWKEMNVEELAESLNIDIIEVREKQKLIACIIKARKKKKISQSQLAKKVGVTQGRIAQIESGVGTSKITFDVLLNILIELGFNYHIVPREVA